MVEVSSYLACPMSLSLKCELQRKDSVMLPHWESGFRESMDLKHSQIYQNLQHEVYLYWVDINLLNHPGRIILYIAVPQAMYHHMSLNCLNYATYEFSCQKSQ